MYIGNYCLVSGKQDETHWDTLSTPEPADGILGKVAEAGKGWEFLLKSTLPETGVKFQVVPSVPNFQIKTKLEKIEANSKHH